MVDEATIEKTADVALADVPELKGVLVQARGLARPDITPMQIVTLVGSVLALLAAFGLPITAHQTEEIVNVVQTLAPAAVLADAVIRHGRAVGRK